MIDTPAELSSDESKDSGPGMPIPVKIVKKEEPVRVTDRRFWAQDQNLTTETSEPTSYSFKPAYVEELENKLAEFQRKLEEIQASTKAREAEADAELRLARERIQNEYARRLLRAKIDIMNKFIEILENFERALEAAKSKSGFDSLLEGVHLIRNQFLATLSELGVSELEVKGKPFDPEIAEAVGAVDVSQEEQDQHIIEVVGKGYMLDQVLVRPARVRVGTHRRASAEASTL